MLLTTISVAIAVDPAGSSVVEVGQYGPITSTTAGTTNVSAGYIRETNLTAIMSTTRWAGIFGNVSGNIQLGDNTSNIMFAWTAEGNLVYVAENQPDWSALVAATASELDSGYAYLSSASSEKAANTFTGAVEDIGSNLFSINATYAETNSFNASMSWKTYALKDNTSTFIFAGKVDQAQLNYRNQTVDFQMIVPENGLNSTATTYSVWVELI